VQEKRSASLWLRMVLMKLKPSITMKSLVYILIAVVAFSAAPVYAANDRAKESAPTEATDGVKKEKKAEKAKKKKKAKKAKKAKKDKKHARQS